MLKVIKGNKVLRIHDEALSTYEKMGYKLHKEEPQQIAKTEQQEKPKKPAE